MKRLIYAVAAVTLSFASCKQGEEVKTVNAADQKIETVKTIKLSTEKVSHTVEYQATMQAFEEIHMAPASPGRIEIINAEIGDRVSKGSLLVQMDRTQLHNAEVQLKNLEADFKRFDTLQKVGSIARQQYDQFMTQYEVAKSNVEFLRENTRLKAPFNGVVSGKYFEAGEMYSGAPTTAAGKSAILSIVQIDKLKALVSLSENYFPLIKLGMNTKVVSDIYPGKEFNGRISLIYPTINSTSRTFNVEVTVDNNQGLLRPGMFSRVTFAPAETEAILLPALAVLKMQGSNERYLFVEKNGVAKRVSVKMGQRYNDLVEVLSDQLHPGDNVVISGQARLLDGVKVQVMN
jgi:RND family efflux transporter MFP subunit